MIDMMLVSGVFEQPARVPVPGRRRPPARRRAGRVLVDRKDTAKALGALPAYDVEELFAHAGSLAARGIGPGDLGHQRAHSGRRRRGQADSRGGCRGDGLTCRWCTWSAGQAPSTPVCATSVPKMPCCCSPTASMRRRTPRAAQVVVAAVEDDAAARGIRLEPPVVAVGYDGFVDLVIAHDASVTWT